MALDQLKAFLAVVQDDPALRQAISAAATADDVARLFGVSVPQTDKLTARALQALLRRPPGPRKATALPSILPVLSAFRSAARSEWDRRGAILEAAVSNVSCVCGVSIR